MVEELNANQFLWTQLSIWQGTEVGGCGLLINIYCDKIGTIKYKWLVDKIKIYANRCLR